jgi:copper chaperone
MFPGLVHNQEGCAPPFCRAESALLSFPSCTWERTCPRSCTASAAGTGRSTTSQTRAFPSATWERGGETSLDKHAVSGRVGNGGVVPAQDDREGSCWPIPEEWYGLGRMKTTSLKIEGMSCEGCVTSVRQVLQKVPGVSDVQVDLARGQATLSRADDVEESDLIAAITDAGYDASLQ